MLKANFHEAQSPDLTPVWQDAPSQTVYCTEEVTQKHKAQVQLDKHAEEHGTRVPQHQQKFCGYYGRASKLKNVQAATAAHPDDLPDEPCADKRKAPWNSPHESPAIVTPRISSAGATPRRSPCVAATSCATTTERMRLVKRRHRLDETYVPDADSDVSMDDAGAAGQHVDDKLITNKRQRAAAVPSASDGKNPGNKKKARVLEKPHGQKNKAEAEDAPADRFQRTVRCSLGEVREAVKLLHECHRAKVREAGFGCVFDWVLEGNVSRVLMCHLLMNIDTSTMKIHCGSGKILDVNREAVHHVFGFPIGGDTAPRPSDSGHDVSLAKLKEELGFERTGSIDTKDLRGLLAKLVKDGTKIDLAVKVFFSILYNKLICPGSTVRLGREAAMLVDMNYKKMATMDFCQLVVDDLKRAAEKYQNSDINQAGAEGCGVVLVAMYLDSCYSVNHSVMHRRTPRANFLHQKPLRDIYHLDQIRSGGSELSAYIFGKLPWKGRNGIVYSYRLPVEDLWTGCSVPSSARSSEHVDSDHEPLTRSQPEFLVTQAPVLDSGAQSPDVTPVWQDAPLQTVYCTEEVTQKHDAQAQLDKYAEEHGTSVAQHQQKFLRYNRRKTSKLKNIQAAAAAHPDDLPDEPCAAKRKAPWNSPQESPTAMTPRVSLAGVTPRRSPRVTATSYTTKTSHHSPSPGKMRLVKRRHTLDETYVPYADSDEKNPGNKKKARVLEKPHGQKNKAEAEDTPTDRFQRTVRCSLGEVREAVKLLQECHRVKIREAGFGCVFDWVLEGNVSRVLMCHLLMKIDTSTMKIQCGSGKVLDVNREAVHHVFGFPIGGDTALRPSDSGHDVSLAKLKEELGFERTGSIDTKDLRGLLAKLVKDGTKIDLAVKVFFSILYNKLICPGSTVRLGREAAMLVDMNYKKMATMDFCQLVVDDLKRAAEKYQNSDINQAGAEGCGVVLVAMYLDSCYSVNHSVMHRRTPRANFLHQKPLRDIYHLDQIRSGGSEVSAYIFGKLPWKGRNDIVYSYRLPVEELRTGCCVPSSARSSEHVDSDHEPLTRSQPEFLGTQAPVLDSGSTPPSTSKSGGSRSFSVIDKIVQLLQKVEDLSRSAPSIDDRLSQMAGLFPPGHGPSTEAVKQVADLEASALDSFATAVSYLRKGFVDLGRKQDAICREYEREAVSVERQMNQQDADKAKSVVITNDDDDDDSVSQSDWKLTGKDVSEDVPVSLPSVFYVTISGLVHGGIQRGKSTPDRNDSPSSKNSRKRKHKMTT